MKKIIILISSIFAFQGLTGQITITSSNMPDTGDTTRLSSAVVLPGTDLSQTGPGYTWDFSMLDPQSQSVEEYVSPTSTPFLYQIIFNQSVANLASPINALAFLPGFNITDAYAFYKKSSSNYVRPGYAATIMGVPIPMKFDLPELFYTFPLQANSQADSSYSMYELAFPNVGYFSIERKRVNVVDGWGELTTPFGTFNTLRVKSVITERDSLYLDSLQFGAPIIRYYTEYKWLAIEFGIPVLTITEEGPLITAIYIDSLRNLNPMTVSLGPDENICGGDTISIAAEVSGGTPPYSYLWNTMDTTAVIKVSPGQTTTYSVLVTDSLNNFITGSKTINVTEFSNIELGPDTLVCSGLSVTYTSDFNYDQLRWYINGELQPPGNTLTIDTTLAGMNTVIVRVEYESATCSGSDQVEVTFYICQGIAGINELQFVIMPNPVKEMLVVEGNDLPEKVGFVIYDMNGRRIRSGNQQVFGHRINIDVKSLKPGSYNLLIINENSRGAVKFIKN